MNNKKIWILGAGRFGRLAFGKFKKNDPACTITIIDKDPAKLTFPDTRNVCDDAITWLCTHLLENCSNVDIIVPVIPVHVAAEWLKLKLRAEDKSCESSTFPDDFLDKLPNPIHSGPGQLLVSFADFICPASCEEPEGFCPHTGQTRPVPLYRLLETLAIPGYKPLVLKSHQLFPGVGGFKPAELRDLYHRATTVQETNLLVGTACSCHGILDSITVSTKQLQ